jgi:flagellar biosynthetic protein FlhB
MADVQDKEQKTEPATPRRRHEARESGQVALSQELVAALMLCAGFAALVFGGGVIARASGRMIAGTLAALDSLGTADFDVRASTTILKATFWPMIAPLLLVFLPAVLVGALAAYGQVGFLVTGKAIQADFKKVDPLQGFQRIFSRRAAMRTFLAMAKITLITFVMGRIAYAYVDDIARAGDTELGPLLVALGNVLVRCAAGALAVILVLALVDFGFQRYQHESDLRMSKEEIKEEHRITEGDPHVKARVRQIMREMATRRMMADVPKATVVVTNPTHYAVALLYERGGDGSAPRCVAKGKGFVARRIKETAREAGVVLYEDVPLARALYAEVEIGREIPEELYAAVAEVLAYVYRLQEKVAAA